MRLSLLLAVAVVVCAAGRGVAEEPARGKQEVCTEVHILKLPAGFCEKHGIDRDACRCLSAIETAKLLDVVEMNPGANIVHLPKVTTNSGHPATIRVCDQKHFVTGLEAKPVDGKIVMVQTKRTIDLGHIVKLCGTVSADQKYVKLHTHLTHTREVDKPGGYRICALVNLIPEGGGTEPPEPHHLWLPVVETIKLEKAAMVPDGGTVVLGGWTEEVVPPSLKINSRIPYLNRFPPRATKCDVLVLATTRVAACEEMECGPQPRVVPVTPAPASPLVQAYPLKRASAAEVVKTLKQLMDGEQKQPRIMFDAECNTVYVQGELAVQERIASLLHAIEEVRQHADSVQVRQLRHIAAVDAVKAIQKQCGEHGLVVVAEPMSNTVMVHGEKLLVWQACRDLTAMDAAPPQVMIEAMVVEVPAEWLADVGLEGGGQPLVLSKREHAMFLAAMKMHKEKGVDILSCPRMQVMDTQTGFVQVGQKVPYIASIDPANQAGKARIETRPVGVTLRVTPRIIPDGKVLLRVESQLSSVSPTPIDLGNGVKAPVFNTQSLQTTALLQDGNSLILTGGVHKLDRVVVTTDGKRKVDGAVRRETLIILSPHRVTDVTPATSVMPPSAAPTPTTTTMPTPAVMPSVGVMPTRTAMPGVLPAGGVQAIPPVMPAPVPHYRPIPAAPASAPPMAVPVLPPARR